jgi:hypothetical protein
VTTLGAVSELLVCVDLMRRGIPVFRATSPACSCDLIGIFDNLPKRIEVTKGVKLASGQIRWAYHDTSRYDILALVFADNSISYLPDPFTV